MLTIPPAVAATCSRRRTANECHLKWAAEPGGGRHGLSRLPHGGAAVNGPGQKVTRLTADPIDAHEVHRPKPGKDTRRYWVVAVDPLGQEGIPSAPAWHWRQYRKFYEPFTGEWHQ